jgi:UDP-N-acetylmuramoylalanine--D-glutamate ligase
VRYYDDSKGTNVGASVAALKGLAEARAVLVAGGRDKGGDYGPLVEALRSKGRALVLIGEAADRIADAAAGALPIERAASMSDAVERASRLARPGDAVLLSPACSSFDMFRDYHDRGAAFVRAVRALGGETDGAGAAAHDAASGETSGAGATGGAS